MAKPMKTLELHYPMIQFLIMIIISQNVLQVVDIYSVIHCQYTVCYSSRYMIVSTKISIERFDSSLYNYQKKDNYIIDDYLNKNLL